MSQGLNFKKGFSLVWDNEEMIVQLLGYIEQAGFDGIEPICETMYMEMYCGI